MRYSREKLQEFSQRSTTVGLALVLFSNIFFNSVPMGRAFEDEDIRARPDTEDKRIVTRVKIEGMSPNFEPADLVLTLVRYP